MVKKISKNTKADIHTTELVTKIAELETNYLRVLADFKNQDRRFREQESQVVKLANSLLLEKLLFVLDSLKLAQAHLQDQGLTLILDQFLKILESEGLKKIETDNLPFDPNTMECSEVVAGEKDRVVETISEGYYLYEKVLRPAKVKVGSDQIKLS